MRGTKDLKISGLPDPEILEQIKMISPLEEIWDEQSITLQLDLQSFLSTYQHLPDVLDIQVPPTPQYRENLLAQEDYLTRQIDYYDDIMNELLKFLQ